MYFEKKYANDVANKKPNHSPLWREDRGIIGTKRHINCPEQPHQSKSEQMPFFIF